MRESCLIALAGVVIGDVLSWQDPDGCASDLARAWELAAELDPADPAGMLARLRDEAREMVASHVEVIGRLADVLAKWHDRLAGHELDAALDFAFQRPAPMPPRRAPTAVLDTFRVARREWLQHLAGQLADPTDAESLACFLEADRRALAQETPPPLTVAAPSTVVAEPVDDPIPAGA